MKALGSNKGKQLLIVGLLTIVASQVIMHYSDLQDSIKGVFFGIGIGLLVVVLYQRRIKLTS
ncbi:hypothetical protein [Marixanthomonas ophiurae]|uniref:Uncharacterized protein n=1 Tax=Marixanthomonas ophiurae TaxID=387659 RepID=A0A3E1Q7F0_9FLAO|nr:hypothetical protein [Marixanthomonas ophiurae]RFN58048.1 hypothetical protein DZ858_12465 [Marixanthomonas ophiurae]